MLFAASYTAAKVGVKDGDFPISSPRVHRLTHCSLPVPPLRRCSHQCPSGISQLCPCYFLFMFSSSNSRPVSCTSFDRRPCFWWFLQKPPSPGFCLFGQRRNTPVECFFPATYSTFCCCCRYAQDRVDQNCLTDHFFK